MLKTQLFKEFESVSEKAWKQKIQFDLKGADYNEALVWESLEGIKTKPFYHSDENIPTAAIRPNEKAWAIGQTIYAGDAQKTNTKALNSLKKGVESLQFIIPTEETPIAVLLKDIDLDKVPIYFDFQFLSATYIKSIVDFAGDAIANIHLNIDLIGNLTSSGNWYKNLEQDHKTLDAILALKITQTLSVDLGHYQNAGANRVQQLAYGLAHANEYLNHLENNGTANADQVITFKVAVGTNYFYEIAKLRALRLVWQALATEYKMNPKCHIIATPTRRNKTLYDYNTNMLRTTTEGMAAILGGADMMTNLPYDAIYHKENEFGNRIAINQLLVLKNESYFDKVKNPADGAYYIEALTQQLAEKALVLFKEIEKAGGFLKQLKAHTIQKKIKENAAKEQALFDENKEVLVGTNTYTNASDKMKHELELYPFVKTNTRKTLIEPIIAKRLAETIEQKRLKDE